MANEQADVIKVVQKAVGILEQLRVRSGPAGVRELSRELDLPTSTAQRILNTLEACGLVEQHEHDRRYQLGRYAFHIGMGFARNLEVRTAALDYMRELRQACGATIGLNIRVGTHRRMLVEQLESPWPISFKAEVGTLYPLARGAPGRVLMSRLAPSEVDEVMRAARDDGEELPDNIYNSLERTRADGYGTAFGELITDLNTIAAPIFDAHGSVVAALGASGPVTRFGPDVIRDVVPTLTRVSGRISRRLGYIETTGPDGPHR